MSHTSNAELRQALSDLARPSTSLAIGLVAIDLAMHYAFLAGATYFDYWAARLACAIGAGATISQLFVIGHDAVHGAYTKSKVLNATIGRLTFLPSLHNYSLWRIAHNRLHHRATCVAGLNSWSPLSPREYESLSPFGRAIYRLYRTPFGFGPYYFWHRWWKDKFFPTRRVVGQHRLIFWCDFALVGAYLLGWLAILTALAWPSGADAVVLSLVFGFVIPYAVWNYLMGFTVYMQHTHPRVPWFRTEKAASAQVGQADISVHVRFWRLYGDLSHHIMDHPAHHVNPKIPLYRLRAAQERLNEHLGSRAIVDDFTMGFLWRVTRSCKLYDYDNHNWLDFSGRSVPVALPIAAATALAAVTS